MSFDFWLVWCVVCGVWCVVCGVWCVVCVCVLFVYAGWVFVAAIQLYNIVYNIVNINRFSSVKHWWSKQKS